MASLRLDTLTSLMEVSTPLISRQLPAGTRKIFAPSRSAPAIIVGPSAGLAMALSIYQMVAPNDLIGSLRIAGTGGISPDGNVVAIVGVYR
jgi:PDZ domain-containing protein